MRYRRSWKECLGIAFRPRLLGRRPYTETMKQYEIWLRDKKGFHSWEEFEKHIEEGLGLQGLEHDIKIEDDRLKEYEYLFFLEHPECFTNYPIKPVYFTSHLQTSRFGDAFRTSCCQRRLPDSCYPWTTWDICCKNSKRTNEQKIEESKRINREFLAAFKSEKGIS